MTITIPQQNIKMDVSTGVDPVWYDKLKALVDAVNLLVGISPIVPANRISASLGADVLLNNTANYFDGPSIAQGSVGTWWVSGTVTVIDTAGAAGYRAKLWDGTTVIASLFTNTSNINFLTTISLSGFITSPAGNLRISVRDQSSISGKILFNQSGNSLDSTISAFRIA